MKSEMCKKCIHTDVCFKDKNICGDVFVPGNPMVFDNNELYRKYEERKKQGFPCRDYFPIVVRCKDCKYYESDVWEKVNGIPLIVAHQICKRWGDGCKTDDNGFCFMGEKVAE